MQRKRKARKEKEENIWRRKTNDDANRPTKQLGEYRAICFFKKKTEDRDLQYSEKENVIPDKQTEFPFSDSTASVEGGE